MARQDWNPFFNLDTTSFFEAVGTNQFSLVKDFMIVDPHVVRRSESAPLFARIYILSDNDCMFLKFFRLLLRHSLFSSTAKTAFTPCTAPAQLK
jgi:hypothetical protein